MHGGSKSSGKVPEARKSNKSSSQASIGIIGGSGLYSMPGLMGPREIKRAHTVRRTFRRVCVWDAGREACGISGASWPRTSHSAGRNQLSRQYLRHEIAGRKAHDLRQRGRLAAGRFAARENFSSPINLWIAPGTAFQHFFGNGLVAHVSFAHPTCDRASRCWPTPACIARLRCIAAARTSAWRDRNFPRWRKRKCTAS